MSKERSPFSPGQPVSPEYFVGREEQVKLLRRAIRQAAAGLPQYVFITGERGIGKSSLACVAQELAEKEYDFVGAQALLGGSESLGEVCRRLYQALLSQLPEKRLVDKARQLFADYVESVDLFGLGVKFKKDNRSRESLAENFLPLLGQMRQSLAEEGRKGILLIADDLNGVSREAQFAHFLKSTVDQIAVGAMRNFPWLLILVGVPERMDDLRAQQPSVDRIFQPIELELMDRDAAHAFFQRAFRAVEHAWEPEALNDMAEIAGGFPVMWHELGDAVFWQDEDQVIRADDVIGGTATAAQNVGRKYLKGPLYDELRSPVYQRIRDYLANSPPPVRRVDAVAQLPAKEARNFDNFIKKMRNLDILRLVPGRRGQYEFTHLLYYYYLRLQSSADARSAPHRDDS